MKIRNFLVRLYPPEWRSRYGDEFEALLEECLHSPLDVVDVALGALDAHLGFYYEIDWRLWNMVNKLRTTILIVFTAYIAFVMGGLSLVGLVDDSPVIKLMKTNTSISAAWTTIQAAAVMALLAVIAGGLPLAVAVVKRAFVPSNPTRRMLLVPVIAFLLLVVYGVFLAALGKGWLHLPGIVPAVSAENFPPSNKLVLGGFILVFILGAVASTAAVWKSIAGLEEGYTQSSPSTTAPNNYRAYRTAFILSMVTLLAMVVMLVGTLVFGALTRSALPDWFSSNLGILLIKTSLSYGITVAIMALATLAALFGVIRGLSVQKKVRHEI